MKNPGKLIITYSILIHAPAMKVWNALTNPQETKKYMFGCETVSDWKAGSPLLWKGSYEGKEMVFVKGSIVEIIPGELLSYTTFDPNSVMADIPENYLTVTYRIKVENGKSMLTVTQGDYSTVAECQKRYADSYNDGKGWSPILEQIKKLVEEG